MRFLVDECAGPALARWLTARGHDVFSVFEQARGANDDSILEQSYREERILITTDKDFGEMIYRERRPHRGVILLRLENQLSNNRIAVVNKLLEQHAEQIVNRYVVVTETRIRFAR